MQLRAFLFFTAIAFSLTLTAQDLAGVWEGSFFLNGRKKQKMNVRLELMESDGEYIGIVSSRGFDKNTAFGCDYLVGGRLYDGKISLVKKEVMRGVAMSKNDCAFFEELYLTVSKNGPAAQLSGRWYWMGEAFDSFTAVKTDSVVSEFTKDEIADYVQDLYKEFEGRNVLLKPEYRLYEKVAEQEVDGSDIMLEFNSVDSSKHDSISVLLNGEFITNDHDLSKRPLRIRLKELAPGMNDVIIISQSIAQNKLKIRLVLKQGEITREYMLEPGFIRNSLLLLKRKEN